MADVGNRPVDEFKDRVGRAKALPKVEIAQCARLRRRAQFGQIACQPGHLPADALFRAGKVFRAGALKTKDRLFVITDDEQRAQLVAMRALPGKEIAGQGIDDLPLRRVGVLRLVNQDMVDPSIELVTDPFGQVAARQQGSGLADLVVEIDEPGPRLGIVPRERELPPDL